MYSKNQRNAMFKIARDLSRFERKRRIAARIIGAQKKELCDLACDNIHLLNNESYFINLSIEQKTEITELNEEIKSLTARLADEQETIAQINEGWFAMSGEVSALKWAFEKIIQK